MLSSRLYTKFITLRLFLAGSATRGTQAHLFSNYFLTGFREKYIITRLRGVFETSQKLFTFCHLSRLSRAQFWILGWSSTYWRVVRWLASATKSPYLITLGGGDLLIFWAGRYFLVDSAYFRFRISKFIGVESAVLVAPPPPSADFNFLPFLGGGVLSIALATPSSMVEAYTYRFYYPEGGHLSIIFYSRLIALFIARAWLL